MSKSILLVEDNVDEANLTLIALKTNAITNDVVVAKDGNEALDYLFATGEYQGRDKTVQPALVLLDVKLPGMGGAEILRRMRAQAMTRFLPVVMLTSSREDCDLIECYSSGCNSYIRKPVNFDEFNHIVWLIGKYWLTVSLTPPPVAVA
jgi:two-component system, response regulator